MLNMPRVQWKSSRTIGLILAIFVLYLALRIRNYEYKAAVFLDKIHPNEAWEFVADFSNMKYLNPTVIDFVITNESGNYDHWQYTIKYTEVLSHWPYFKNYAIAHFNVKSQKDVYLINSVHKTCLFLGVFCLESESEFKFTQSNKTALSKGAFCEESIIYQCPAFLSSFCKREVEFQRVAIMHNLKKYFIKRI